MLYCDDCGRSIDKDEDTHHFVSEMPCDFTAGNKGESAVLCDDCYRDVMQSDE